MRDMIFFEQSLFLEIENIMSTMGHTKYNIFSKGSVQDGYPWNIIESMAVGTPTIYFGAEPYAAIHQILPKDGSLFVNSIKEAMRAIDTADWQQLSDSTLCAYERLSTRAQTDSIHDLTKFLKQIKLV